MRRRCACRGALEADPTDSAEVAAVVVRHQKTIQHSDWWREQSIADEKIAIPVRMATVRRVA